MGTPKIVCRLIVKGTGDGLALRICNSKALSRFVPKGKRIGKKAESADGCHMVVLQADTSEGNTLFITSSGTVTPGDHGKKLAEALRGLAADGKKRWLGLVSVKAVSPTVLAEADVEREDMEPAGL